MTNKAERNSAAGERKCELLLFFIFYFLAKGPTYERLVVKYAGCPKKSDIISQACKFGKSCWNSLTCSQNVLKQIKILYLMFYFCSVFRLSSAVHLEYSCTQSPSCDTTHPVHILNTNEIGPTINLWCSTPALFNFTELDLVVFKVSAFKIMAIFLRDTLYLQMWCGALFCFNADTV